MDYKRRMILAAHAEGLANAEIAARVRCSLWTVAATLKANGLTKHPRRPRRTPEASEQSQSRYKVHHLLPTD